VREQFRNAGLAQHEWLVTGLLNVGPGDVILMKKHIVQLPHIDHFAALLALVKVRFLRVV
jgi:hypothetical protein